MLVLFHDIQCDGPLDAGAGMPQFSCSRHIGVQPAFHSHALPEGDKNGGMNGDPGRPPGLDSQWLVYCALALYASTSSRVRMSLLSWSMSTKS